MLEMINVDTGQISVRCGRFILKASALGSCIAVTAYDAKARNGGMAHIMLPGRATQKASEKMRYAFNGVEHLFNQMIHLGSELKDIEVCLIGAGNVLRKDDDTICRSNIHSVTAILAEKNVPLRASVLGGRDRKSALLDTQTGYISYTRGDSPVALLWRPSKDFRNDALLAAKTPGR